MAFDYSYSSTEKARHKAFFISENTLLVLFSLTVFFIPIVLIHVTIFPNQLVIGTLVNSLLAGSALYLTFKKSLPVILLPAIGALISGIIFGPFTAFLAYLVPFIWIGNALYVYFIKNINLVNKINYIPAVLISSFLKAAFLFSSTFALVSFGIIPGVFLVPMGIIQFATALIGGFIAGASLLVKKT